MRALARRRCEALCAAGVLLASAALLALPAGAPALTLDPRSIRSATLTNGLRLVVCEDQAASVVSVGVVVRAGSADESPAESGIAHLLEHICWVGAADSDPREAIEEVGGYTNAGTLRDFTRYYAIVQPADFARSLQALGDMLLRDEFDAAAISRQRSLILSEAASRMDRPRAALNDLAFASLYGDAHPYGRHIEGTEQTLSRVTSASLSRFHRTWYVPNNMAVIVAGKVGFDAALAEVKRVFGGLAPAALPPRSRPPMPRPAEGGEVVVEAPVQEAYLMAAFVGPAISEPMAVASSDVLATLLAHPQMGRLARELRDRRALVKAIGVDFLTQRERGLFGVWAVCEPATIPAAQEAIAAELARAASQPLAAGELASAKRLLASDYAFANETAGDRAGSLGFYEAIDTYRTASQYLGLVHAVTAEQIAATAAWYAGKPVWVVIKPAGGDQ